MQRDIRIFPFPFVFEIVFFRDCTFDVSHRSQRCNGTASNDEEHGKNRVANLVRYSCRVEHSELAPNFVASCVCCWLLLCDSPIYRPYACSALFHFFHYSQYRANRMGRIRCCAVTSTSHSFCTPFTVMFVHMPSTVLIFVLVLPFLRSGFDCERKIEVRKYIFSYFQSAFAYIFFL